MEDKISEVTDCEEEKTMEELELALKKGKDQKIHWHRLFTRRPSHQL
jgi:hypothetical protein